MTKTLTWAESLDMEKYSTDNLDIQYKSTS